MFWCFFVDWKAESRAEGRLLIKKRFYGDINSVNDINIALYTYNSIN
jgi:hypothetical protein